MLLLVHQVLKLQLSAIHFSSSILSGGFVKELGLASLSVLSSKLTEKGEGFQRERQHVFGGFSASFSQDTLRQCYEFIL